MNTALCACFYNEPMRRLNDKLRAGMVSWVALSVTAAGLLAGSGCLHAQSSQQQTPFPTAPQPSNGRVLFGTSEENSPDPSLRHAQDEALRKRNIDRQKQLVADTNKLLQLSQELKSEVDKSSKDTLSVAVVKKAEEIEKLARSVKDRMKAQ